MSSLWPAARKLILIGALTATALAATRPRYGGVLRVEVHESLETAGPPQTGPGMADLQHGFTITEWTGGRRAVYAADENAAGGRPFLDSVEIQLGRPLREESFDLELGRADVVEVGPNELRRPQTSRRVWSSMPVRIVALAFGPRVDDARIREALSLAVDRPAIHAVLLQRQGEISGALLPQWLSGYSFLFPAAADVTRARSLIGATPPSSRSLTLAVADPALRQIADRVAVNARDAGLNVNVISAPSGGDVQLAEARITTSDPAKALAQVASAFGLAEPQTGVSAEALYTAERTLLDGFRVVPLFHLPYSYGVSPRVKGGSGITPLGEWNFGNLWLGTDKP
jgi:ABC-type transport system substrate-binding protein